MIEFDQILWIVREVSIHFQDILVISADGPMKPGDICCAQSLFARSLQQVKTRFLVIENVLKIFDDLCSTIRRIIVYNEHIEIDR